MLPETHQRLAGKEAALDENLRTREDAVALRENQLASSAADLAARASRLSQAEAALRDEEQVLVPLVVRTHGHCETRKGALGLPC